VKKFVYGLLTLFLAVLIALAGCSNPAESEGTSTGSESSAESESKSSVESESAENGGSENGENSSDAESPSEPSPEPVLSTSAIEPEDGFVKVTMHSLDYDRTPPATSDILDDEVTLSFELPEGWTCSASLADDRTYLLELRSPELKEDDDDSISTIKVYKDDGTVFDRLLEYNSLWSFPEDIITVEPAAFEKGSYVHFGYPEKLYDEYPDAIRVYLRRYQLQFEGYVVSADIYIRLYDSPSDTERGELICDSFISSLALSRPG